MAKTGKAGIGSFVMRGHEYLVAILAENGLLRAEVLRYAGELRTPQSIGLAAPGKADAGRVKALAREIEALGKPSVDPAELSDREAECAAEARAAEGEVGQGVIAMAELEDPDDDAGAGGEVIDLMGVLRESLGAKAAGAGSARAAPSKAAPAKKAPRQESMPAKKTARQRRRRRRRSEEGIGRQGGVAHAREVAAMMAGPS